VITVLRFMGKLSVAARAVTADDYPPSYLSIASNSSSSDLPWPTELAEVAAAATSRRIETGGATREFFAGIHAEEGFREAFEEIQGVGRMIENRLKTRGNASI
jgi:hypothetical protein